jgi:Tfp pilus assembly protein PilF
MRQRRARVHALATIGLLVFAACAGMEKEERTLSAPAGTPAPVVAAMDEGNRLFATRQWALAKAQYENAINAQPSLAEAHYNLAATLEMLGDDLAARQHYIKAANLAPGHRVIWDSPPLRRHGLVDSKVNAGSLIAPSSQTP